MLRLRAACRRDMLRDVAQFLPACVTTVRRLREHDVGAAAGAGRAADRNLPLGALADRPAARIPARVGPLDQVVAAVLLPAYAARAIPRETLLEAWPAERRLLERLLGS